MRTFITLVFFSSISFFGYGQCTLDNPIQSGFGETLIYPCDSEPYDRFGWDVSISGSQILIGAQDDNPAGIQSGSIYHFEYDGTSFMELGEIIPADAAPFSNFGHAVRVDGNVAMISAHRWDGVLSNQGAVYFFRYDGTTWVEEAKFVSINSANAELGIGIDLKGNNAVAGSSAGIVQTYFYDGTNWLEQDQLSIPTGLMDEFGKQVAISGNSLAVGAKFGLDLFGLQSGIVHMYAFDGTTWLPTEMLAPADREFNDKFGTDVELDGNTLLVNSLLAESTDDVTNDGVIYEYEFDGSSWTEKSILSAPDNTTEMEFGEHMILKGNRLVVGSRRNSDQGNFTGAAYVYDRVGGVWTETKKLVAFNAIEGDFLSNAVAFEGDMVILGCEQRDRFFPNSGAIYAYDLNTYNHCSSPIGLEFLSAIDFLTWKPVFTGTKYKLSVREKLNPSVFFRGGAVNNYVNVDFLTPSTEYEWIAQAKCGSTNGKQTQVSEFTTSALRLENAVEGTWEVYPNPATDHIWISGLEEQARVFVYDEAGRQVLSQLFSGNTSLRLNLSALSTGLYRVVVESNSETTYKAFAKF